MRKLRIASTSSGAYASPPARSPRGTTPIAIADFGRYWNASEMARADAPPRPLYRPKPALLARLNVTNAVALDVNSKMNGSLLDKLSHQRSGVSTQPPLKLGILPS